MRKTKEVDNLINLIADQLSAGAQPSKEDAADLECLWKNYLEHENRNNMASKLGLRNRAIRKPSTPVECNPECIQKLIYHLLYSVTIEDECITQATAMLRAYTKKEITASALFGERYRKPRNNIGWQAWRFMGVFAADVRTKIVRGNNKRLSVKKDCAEYTRSGQRYSHLEEGNLYHLCEDLSSSIPITEVAASHDVLNVDLLDQLRTSLREEGIEDEVFLDFIPKNTWYAAHKMWIEEMDDLKIKEVLRVRRSKQVRLEIENREKLPKPS